MQLRYVTFEVDSFYAVHCWFHLQALAQWTYLMWLKVKKTS